MKCWRLQGEAKKMAIETSKKITKNARGSEHQCPHFHFIFLNVSSLKTSQCMWVWRCGHGGLCLTTVFPQKYCEMYLKDSYITMY